MESCRSRNPSSRVLHCRLIPLYQDVYEVRFSINLPPFLYMLTSITRHNDVQNLIKRNMPEGVSVDIDYASK